MNTPEQNEKNLLAMKKYITEILLSLSIAWIGYWILVDIQKGMEFIPLLCSAILIHFLRFLKVSLKSLYLLTIISFLMAVLVTYLFP